MIYWWKFSIYTIGYAFHTLCNYYWHMWSPTRKTTSIIRLLSCCKGCGYVRGEPLVKLKIDHAILTCSKIQFKNAHHEQYGTERGTVLENSKDRNMGRVRRIWNVQCLSVPIWDTVVEYLLLLLETVKCYLFFQGFPLTVCPPAILRIAKHACEKNKVFCMNLSAPFLCQFYKEPMLQVLPYVDILFGNESVSSLYLQLLFCKLQST